jgi:hypothetical protein
VLLLCFRIYQHVVNEQGGVTAQRAMVFEFLPVLLELLQMFFSSFCGGNGGSGLSLDGNVSPGSEMTCDKADCIIKAVEPTLPVVPMGVTT